MGGGDILQLITGLILLAVSVLYLTGRATSRVSRGRSTVAGLGWAVLGVVNLVGAFT